MSSVAELEPVEQHIFAGAGAKVFLARLWSWLCKLLENVTENRNFSYFSLKLTLKFTILLLFTLNNLLIIIDVSKKHEFC
jgi:hypothetical protein